MLDPKKIETAKIPFESKAQLWQTLKSLEESDSKIDNVLAALADKLFAGTIDADSVNYFNDLVSTIKALTIDYNKLGTMQRVSYLKMLGAKVDKKMSNDQLNEIYEELVK